MNINAGRVGTAGVVAVRAPSASQLEAAALRKIKHPEAAYEADALGKELAQQRAELAEMSELLGTDPEGFDRYFDQVAETGEVKQGDSVTVTVEQVPAKKTPAKKAPRKVAQKKATTRRQVEAIDVPARMQIESTPPPIVPIIPVPPAQPGSQTVQQEE